MKHQSSKLDIKKKVLQRLEPLINLINKGQERSVKAKKNILASLGLKGVSIVLSFLLVPMALNFVSVSEYGVWLTLSSIVTWFSFFDIGLTQGLRNKLAEAIAHGEDKLARIYISTTYAILGMICTGLWVIFMILNGKINWVNLLNLPAEYANEVSMLAIIVFTYFCFQFVLKVINTVFTALQQPAMSNLLSVSNQAVQVICIFILIKTTKGSLSLLGAVYCGSSIFVLLLANIFSFRGKYKKFRPSFSSIDLSFAKPLFNLGVVFFIIQIAGIIQYQTASIIIAKNFTTSDVTAYNIVYKYFGMLSMIFIIFVTPFWSASTEAYLKNDISWIKKGIKKYNQLTILLSLIGLVMLLFSGLFYDAWLGKGKVDINFILSFWGLLYFISSMFASTYVFFLNGINALRLQFISCLFSPILYIGIALILIRFYKLGTYSLFIASIICNFNGLILAPLQYHMIVNKKKKGIWIR